MQQINIEKEGNLLSIKAPWNPLFIEELKKLHGKWNPDEKVWTVNDFAQEQLNVAIRRVFGNISGSAIETVKCSVVSEIKQEKTAITFFGKVIAAAKDKNTKMHHDDEVIYTIGEPTAGGSKKHWYSIIPQGSEFIIHDVPVDLYQNYVDGTGIYASLRKNIVIVEKR